MSLRVAIVNPVWSGTSTSFDETIDRFTTLTGWAAAVRAAGVGAVAVYQRFHRDGELTRGGIRYTFVRRAESLYRDAASFEPDVAHVNGLHNPLHVRRLRRTLPAACAIVVQDHGGFAPRALSRPRQLWIRMGLRAADALLVATPPQIEEFRDSGCTPRGMMIRDVMEGSTWFRPTSNRDLRAPLALLWVGRLNANKDPLTVAEGFARFVAHRPEATLTFIYSAADLEPALRATVERSSALRDRVRLIGAVPHAQMADWYSSADVLVLGSHHEGSGYAVLEAMACGCIPVLTDIPAFRGLTQDGLVGELWRVGDPLSLAAALDRVSAIPLESARAACRAFFEERWSWNAIGRRAAQIYDDVARSRSNLKRVKNVVRYCC